MGATGQNSLQIEIRRPNPLRSEPIREWIRIVMVGLWLCVVFSTSVGLVSKQDWSMRWLVGCIASGAGLLVAYFLRKSRGLLLVTVTCCAIAAIAIVTAYPASVLTTAIAACATGLVLGTLAWGKFPHRPPSNDMQASVGDNE